MSLANGSLRAASTVIVARPGPNDQYQIFMVRRSTKSVFMPDVFVFPGGKLDLADTTPEALDRITGWGAKTVFRDTPQVGAFEDELPLTEVETKGLWLAALRELFEEAGVLLAVSEDGGGLPDGAKLAQYRQAMRADEVTFTQMLEREKLLADVGRLTYFSHWITPPVEPRRFDTRFFLAVVDAKQEAEADLYELTEGYWLTPQQALNRSAEGDFTLIFPTRMHVERMAARPTLPELVDYARSKEIVAAMPITPEPGLFVLPPEILERW